MQYWGITLRFEEKGLLQNWWKIAFSNLFSDILFLYKWNEWTDNVNTEMNEAKIRQSGGKVLYEDFFNNKG